MNGWSPNHFFVVFKGWIVCSNIGPDSNDARLAQGRRNRNAEPKKKQTLLYKGLLLFFDGTITLGYSPAIPVRSTLSTK